MYDREAVQERVEGILKCPDVLKPWLGLLYGEDLPLVAALGGDILSEEEIGSRLEIEGACLKDTIWRAYRTVTLNKVVEGETVRYALASLGLKVNCIATFHPDIWHAIPETERRAIAAWHYQGYLGRKKALFDTEGIDPIAVLSENENRVVPIDQAVEYLKNCGEEIRIIPCDCKSTVENCHHERSVCFDFRHGPNTPSDRGYGKVITSEEGVELLRRTEKMGLMHTLESHAICSCCSCCCYPMRASMELGIKGQWPKVLYRVVLEKSRCINCGLCVRRCGYGVFSVAKGGSSPSMDVKKCWGCGVCVSSCPKAALSLVPLSGED